MYARGKGALRRNKTTKSKGIGMSTRIAIATRFLYVLIFFLVRKFEFDFVVPVLSSETYHTIKE